MFIIAGLGNPGKKYERTRHNMGFMALDLLADKYGIKVDRLKFKALTGEEPDLRPASTDANIPLSLGIPANTVGAVRYGLSHTREEWVELASLKPGLGIALSLMLRAFL